MCMYIGSEVIMSNLLGHYRKSDEGIGFAEIEHYCAAVKEAIMNDNSAHASYISFRINDDELESALQLYPGVFKKFMNRYYKGKNFGAYNFEARVKPEVNQVMIKAASSL